MGIKSTYLVIASVPTVFGYNDSVRMDIPVQVIASVPTVFGYNVKGIKSDIKDGYSFRSHSFWL